MECDGKKDYLHYLKHIPATEVLVLAGDVGNPTDKMFSQFLRCCSDRHAVVIYVPGNHEHWFMDLPALDSLCRSVGVAMLHNGTLTYKGITFAGTTFWTSLKTLDNRDIGDDVLGCMNDMKYIPGMTRDIWLEKHEKAVAFVRQSLRKFDRVVVVTHHSPTFCSVARKYRKMDCTACYASHCDNLFSSKSLVAWVHGHTHHTTRLVAKSGAILINNSGRNSEYQRNGWNLHPDAGVLTSPARVASTAAAGSNTRTSDRARRPGHSGRGDASGDTPGARGPAPRTGQ
jgi:Icc-related predicted phosphoesterase